MPIKVITPPATEPLAIAEVMAHLKLDEANQEPAPTALTVALLSPAAAGNVNNGAHRYLVTFVTASGETQAGTPSAAVTIANKTINGKTSLTDIPLGSIAVTARNIYRTQADGTIFYLLDTLSDNTTTNYIDNIADASLGVGAPAINTTEDPILIMLIASARAAAEQELKRYLITQTLDLVLDCFPKCGVEIRLPPIWSIESIKYIDTHGIQQELYDDDYLLDIDSTIARITPAYDLSWPSTRPQMNAVRVRFIAGYGSAANVPACIKSWMLIHIANLWENRASMMIDARSLVQIPQTFIDRLLDPERIYARW
ncbi:MAG: hypothetical protein V4501_08090 [Pseudomonadota bacterium]